jgi:tetratricopeptide (TPR) repeat protein
MSDGSPPAKDGGTRAVVIPFGVPVDGRGLGLGLAALVHSFSQIAGQSIALAQLLTRKQEGEAPPGPVEAFVPPQAWRDLAGAGNTPGDVGVVVTGAFEPPSAGRGMIQILAFDGRDGTTRAKVEAHLDGPRAGERILAAFDEVWSRVGGDIGMVRDIRDLEWDALESVLRAERCVLHDPLRGGPYDQLAAMAHLGRAVGDAPEARFPAGRLAAIALETALSPASDRKLTEAALRALARAADDAPHRVELLEATAALHARMGNPVEAEAYAVAAIAKAPDRARAYALLSEARRGRGNLDGALEAVNDGLQQIEGDHLLVNERGVVLAERGDLEGAERAWRDVLAREPGNAAAFANLATIAAKRGDAVTGQALVDLALSAHAPHPDVLRRAIHLALATEADGVARAARIARLAVALTERAPGDAWAALALGRADAQLGDVAKAKEQFARVEALAPDSAFAAEAQRGRFALVEPQAAVEMDAVLRAAYAAPGRDLDAIAARARRLALVHSTWTAWFAAGIAERRSARWRPARDAFEAALGIARGCSPAHLELVGACISLGDASAAVRHAEQALRLDGPNTRTLSVLATALFATRRVKDADVAIRQALALDPADAGNRALAARIQALPAPPARGLARLRGAWGRWRKR